MFYRKATDAEARAWLARKQVIAWGIINELSLEIECLEAEQAKGDQEHKELQITMNQAQVEHERHVEALEGTYKE